MSTIRGHSDCAGKRDTLNAERFWQLFHTAREAAIAELGERWAFTSADNCCWLEIPPKLRSFRGKLGIMIRNPRDIRAPAARFWQDGIPAAVQVSPDFPRETGKVRAWKESDYAAWAHKNNLEKVKGRWLPCDPRPVGEAAA